MLTRRGLAASSICSAIGLVATGVNAQPLTPKFGGVRETIVGREDVPGSGFETVQMLIEIDQGLEIPRHTNPGIASLTLLSGQGELYVQGRPDRLMTPGDMYLIPTSVPHGIRYVTEPSKLAVTYVVEKGKPLESPAPG